MVFNLREVQFTYRIFFKEKQIERETSRVRNLTMSSPKKDDQIRRSQLQVQFHSTRREDFQTIEAYVEKLKSVANSLAEMDSQISDSDMVLQLLAGLPTQYLPLQNTILSRSPLPNFEEACSILYMHEDILLQDRHGEQNTSDPGDGDAEQSSAFFTKDKFYAVMDTLGTVAAAAGAVGTICVVAGPLGTTAAGAVGTVVASRKIWQTVGAISAVAGAVDTISAVAGWKIWETVPPKQHDEPPTQHDE